jgi:PHD/YefM family antitoxin component YafN of YafNO toxin-antitoxin module
MSKRVMNEIIDKPQKIGFHRSLHPTTSIKYLRSALKECIDFIYDCPKPLIIERRGRPVAILVGLQKYSGLVKSTHSMLEELINSRDYDYGGDDDY